MEDVPAPDSLTLKVAFDRKEHSAAQVAAMKRGPLLRRPVVTFSAAVVGGLLLVQVSGVLRHLFHPAMPVAARALVAIGGMVLLAFAIWPTARQREEAERHEHNPDVYTLSDAGLEIGGAEDLTLLSPGS